MDRQTVVWTECGILPSTSQLRTHYNLQNMLNERRHAPRNKHCEIPLDMYTKFQKGEIKGRGQMTAREHKRTFQGDGNVFYLGFGDSYTDVYICQNSLKHILQMDSFYSKYVYLYSKEFNLTPKEVWPLPSTFER